MLMKSVIVVGALFVFGVFGAQNCPNGNTPDGTDKGIYYTTCPNTS